MTRYFIPIVLCVLYMSAARADVIVRIEIQQGSIVPNENLDLRLFNEVASLSVANFMNYAYEPLEEDEGRYINSFFHRSVPGFVIQGGGFTFDPALNDGTFSYNSDTKTFNGGLQEVESDDPVTNEFSKSNVKGTIAIAKLPGDPDSGSSQWFINLVDNSGSLDTENGGYTVFAELMGDSMTTVETMVATHTAVSKTDVHSAFGALPLVNYTDGDTIDDSKLIRISSVSDIANVTGDVGFCPVLVTNAAQRDVTVKNISDETLNIGSVGSTDSLAPPFSMTGADTCSSQSLAPAESCKFTIDFNPQSEDTFLDSINIDISSPTMIPPLAVEYSLAVGPGVVDIVPDIDPLRSELDFGEVRFETDPNVAPEQRILYIENIGSDELNITSATLSGPDAADFTLFDNCVLVSPIKPKDYCVPSTYSCLLPLNLTPSSLGTKTAELVIESDDPDESTLIIPIKATVSDDTDNVDIKIESKVNHTGDANGDFIADGVQSHVTSLVADTGQYITVVSDNLVNFRAVKIIPKSKLVSAPEDSNFALGALKFNIELLALNTDSILVGLLLPDNIEASSFSMYGPTPTNTNPHWYKADYDGIAGASFLGKGDIELQDGSKKQYNLVAIRVIDGGPGDADMVEDGMIRFEGAVNVDSINSNDEGAFNIYYLSILLMTPFLLRRRKYYTD